MSNNPDEIRADIEATRRELGQDVDALADKVTPTKIMDRQVGKVKSAVGSVKDRVMGATTGAKERVMGVTSDTKDRVKGATTDAREGLAEAPHLAADKARGNPLAAGLIAFGVGMLAASLVPASKKEKELANSIKDAAQPLVGEVTDAAKQMGENLRQPAQEAAASLKDTATEAVGNVKSQASSSASDVTNDAKQAARTVKHERA